MTDEGCLITKKVGKHTISLDCTKDGMTIWINGRWIMDASCFMDDSIIKISRKRTIMKEDTRNKKITFRVDKRFK